MNPQPPHFIIEAGPERGRELVIPPEGARIGRATENDISLADAAMSRFQCRVYFRDGYLHIMDLGSTNETLLNEKPVDDHPLRHGDEVLIGESILRVVNDGLTGQSTPPPAGEKSRDAAAASEPAPIIFHSDADSDAEAPQPAPISVPEPVAAPIPDTPAPAPEPAPAPIPPPSAPLTDEEVDLGLGRRAQSGTDTAETETKTNFLLITLVTILVVMVVGVVFLFLTPQDPEPTEETVPADQLHLHYEKVIAGEGNIYRYAVEISPDRQIYAEIHDLINQRNITRQDVMSESAFEQLSSELLNRRDSFFGLRGTYEGVGLDLHETQDITLIVGRTLNRVRVVNHSEPDAFREVREQIEAFVDNELDLGVLSQPPEVLRREADRAWENARKLYEERDVKNSNLWDATQQLRQVTWLLETIEPKPAYYRDALRLQEEWRDSLERRVRDMRFEAAREYQVGNRERAVEIWRRILATLPERSHSLYQQSYHNLIQVEQELNR